MTVWFGTSQSFSPRGKQRTALSFETKQDAVIHSNKRKAQGEAGELKGSLIFPLQSLLKVLLKEMAQPSALLER